MTNTRRHRFIQGMARALRLYLLLLGLSAALAVPAYLILRHAPPVEPPADPVARAPYRDFAPVGTSPVMCLVSETARAQGAAAGTFQQLDAGRWWVNLAGVLGPIRLEDVETLAWPPPAGVQVLVVTAAAGPAMESRADALENWARDGRVVVIERPRGRLLELAGARSPEGGRRVIGQVTMAGLRARLPIELEPVLIGVEGKVVMWGEEGSPAGSQTATAGKSGAEGRAPGGPAAVLPATAGKSGAEGRAPGAPAVFPAVETAALTTSPTAAPLAWVRRLGGGGIVGIAGDLAGAFLRRIQGTPRADFTFEPPARSGALAGIPVPSDMAGQGAEESEPTLDLLAGALWDQVSSIVPVPGWWDIPEGAAGAYMCSHDEEGFGDRSAFMAEEEGRRQVATTFFILPSPMTGKGMADLQRHGAEVALHWHRGFAGGNLVERRFGPLVWERRALELAEQQRTVSALAAGSLPPITRIHGLQWDADFDTTFRKLAAAGLELDSSYGPIASQSPWTFGSVRAFRPLDREGRLLPLLELPFVLQDDEAPPLATLRRVVDVGAERMLPILPIFHVNTMAYKPSVGPIEAWLEGFERAAAKGMWVGTMGEYLRFLKARQASSIEAESWDGRVWKGRVTAVEGTDGRGAGRRARDDAAGQGVGVAGPGGSGPGGSRSGVSGSGGPGPGGSGPGGSAAGAPGAGASHAGAANRSGGQWLRLPLMAARGPLVEVTLEGSTSVQVRCPGPEATRTLVLLRVPAGSHALSLRYGEGRRLCETHKGL